MPRTKSTKNTKKFDQLSLREQIAAAMPVARALIHEGIDTYTRDDDSIVDRVEELLDDPKVCELNANTSSAAHDALANQLEAARAIGIALGIMLRPEAFNGPVNSPGDER